MHVHMKGVLAQATADSFTHLAGGAWHLDAVGVDQVRT